MDDVKIVKLLPEHAHEVAKLHISGIHTGFISSYGIDFVTALYEAIATSEHGFGFVALKDTKIVGFSSFAIDVSALYKCIIFRNGIKFALVLSKKMLSFRTAKAVFETLFYPKRIKKMNLPSAEFLSMVVAKEARGMGLASALMQSGFQECAKNGIEKIKILAAVHIVPINKMYEKNGFDLVAQIKNHGVLSNIYVTYTDDKKRAKAKLKKSDFKYRPIRLGQLPPVFVTFGWCRSSYAVIWSLGRRGINVNVGDASPLAMSRFSRYCKSFTKLPDFFVESEKYFEETCKAIKKTGAEVLLPGHEDVGIFSRHRNDLPSNVNVALPEWDNYRLAEDKFAVLDLAQNAGCPVPHTRELGSLQELEHLSESTDWPVVIKTRIGNSAKGVRIAREKKELLEKFEKLFQMYNLPKNRWPVIQEFLPGEAAGVCVLYDRGRCVVSFAERYLRCKEPGKFGTSTLRETFDDDQLTSRAISIMDKLEWHGVAHLDFVADGNGEFKLIEINPRLWGALALAMFSGVDFPYLWYLTAIGRNDMDPGIIQNRKIKCRWVIGDCLAFAGLIKRGRLREAIRLIIPERKCYHDDFIIRDPLPLLLEICDYFTKFIKAGGSMNPVVGNMIR